MNETAAPPHIQIRTPGKLILSGEHAVVYGAPAIGFAVNRYLDVSVRWLKLAQWTFDLMGVTAKRVMTVASLRRLKRKIEQEYHGFQQGNRSIRDVLRHPFELSLYTASNLIETFKAHIPSGVGISTESNIPTGAGMGSSAACVVGLVKAMSHLLNLDLKLSDYIDLGIASENLQHGYSSGFDVNIVFRGGCCLLEEKKYQALHYPSDWQWQLVYTGSPVTSTGECIAHAKPHLTNSRLSEFEQITRRMATCLQESNFGETQTCLRENQQLLQSIGVVPSRVQTFIEACNNTGAAAKVCGAGASCGEAAGMVLVLSEQSIANLCDQYGYQLLPIQVEQRGSHVL